MSKYVYLLDPGHGGIINGQYVTPGKRSPKMDDNTVLYEGVNNRDIVKRVLAACAAEGIEAIDIVNSNVDVSLTERVKRASDITRNGRKAMYISIHSDAAGDGNTWHPASGLSVYTSKGQTKSDVFASLLIDSLQEKMSDQGVKWRTDEADTDEDKEENFYVLKETPMPAVLAELGFHTNKEECKKMLTESWKKDIVEAIMDTIRKWEKL